MSTTSAPTITQLPGEPPELQFTVIPALRGEVAVSAIATDGVLILTELDSALLDADVARQVAQQLVEAAAYVDTASPADLPADRANGIDLLKLSNALASSDDSRREDPS